MGGSFNTKIDGNFSTALFNVTSNAVTFDYITLSNPNTSSNASLINFSGTDNTCFVTSCYLETNEFAITSNIKNLVVKGNLFIFLGNADSHRYIWKLFCY